MMRSTFLRFILPVALLGLFGFGCLRIGPRIVKGPGTQKVQFEDVASEDSSQGIAYIQLNGSSGNVTRGMALADAQDGAELLAGDRVKVASGTMTLIYPDSGASQLEAGTEIVLVADGAGTGSVFSEIQLVAGNIWTRFERVLGTDEHFSVTAQGVVATVRGTGFGVMLQGEDVEIEVADHSVEVGVEGVAPARLAAGQGIKINKQNSSGLTAASLRAKVRKLAAQERAAVGFAFGLRKIPFDKLRRPAKIKRLLNIMSQLSPEQQERLQILRQQVILQVPTSGFSVPLRGVLDSERAPTSTTPEITASSTRQPL